MLTTMVRVLAAATLLAGPAAAEESWEKALALLEVSSFAEETDERAGAAERQREAREAEREAKEAERDAREAEEDQYEAATELLDEGQWEQAIRAFDQIANGKSRRADAALYWKAYAQNKRGQRGEAAATLAQLAKAHPSSRWRKDGAALELEMKQASGQPVSPESESDHDLKMLAIDSLMHSDPARAIPMLEKVLNGAYPPSLKERALFVLSQSGSPEARAVVVRVAKGQAHPDLQRKAVRSLGLFGGAESRAALAEIYSQSTDVDVKKAVLQSFMLSGDRARVLAAAKTEKNEDLRLDAIRQLGLMGAQDEVWQLYQTETSVEVKEGLIQAMFLGGNAERLVELARTEKNPELRLKAVRNMGLVDSKRTGPLLISMYTSERDREVRSEVLKALFIQNNAKALVEIARGEKDPELKREAVRHLSLMRAPEATSFLMEILNK